MAKQPLRAPTTTTSPVADTTAGLFTFDPPVKAVILQNTTGQTLKIKINGTVVASAAVYDFQLTNNGERELVARNFGVGAFDKIHVWMPSGATEANFKLPGA